MFNAKLRHLNIAPRKVRLIADLIRGKNIEEAQKILNFTIKRGAAPMLKVLNSAIANAKNILKKEKPELYISKIVVDEGPKLKRWQPRARGQAGQIQKKTSHIMIYLEEKIRTAEPEEIKKEIISEEGKVKEKREKVSEAKKKRKPIRGPKIEISKPKIAESVKKTYRRKAF